MIYYRIIHYAILIVLNFNFKDILLIRVIDLQLDIPTYVILSSVLLTICEIDRDFLIIFNFND